MTEVLMSFKRAVQALQGADLVVIQDKNSGDRAVADFVGWEEEGEENSVFVVGAEGWEDVYLRPEENIVREGNTLKPRGICVVLELYRKKK